VGRHTNPGTLTLRRVARSMGLTRLFVGVLARDKYEATLAKAMVDAIAPGETVWDVGANVGHYVVQPDEGVVGSKLKTLD